MIHQQQVKLITITPDAGNLIAYCARVSNPSNQENFDTAPKLLKYMIKNNHWSPFEMAHMVVEINTTRDIARQILRHRSFSFQEFSQRYSDQIEFSTPREARTQDTKNRQNSVPTYQDDIVKWWREVQEEAIRWANNTYFEAIAKGVAKEVARTILPEGLTQSRLYMAGSIRSWIHYYQLRSSNGTQKEHQIIADQIGGILKEQLPSIWEAIKLYETE